MIVLKNISKKYSSKEKKYIGKYFLRNMLHNLWNAATRKEDMSLYVLRDISLSINNGEHVGIIGRNKAGKSTMLQIVSGILDPTAGEMTVEGKIIPVFGQGSISTPDLTGREYITLYAVALGASKKEIDALAQTIIDYSEIPEIDTPVKFYSTGMRTRLSLAVTLLLPADIYILDEVFYGSDVFFKDKTAQRIHEIQADPTKTVIMVSHHEEVLKKFCDRLIFIEKGMVVADDKTDIVLEAYKANNN